jgi:hypothetical protein
MPSAKTIALGVAGLFALGVVGLVMRRDSEREWEFEPVSSATVPTTTSPHSTISVARLSSPKTPDNCADVTFWDAKPIDYKHLQERGFVVLKSTCSKTFKDLPVFATCTRSDKDEHHAPILDAVAYYYDLATVGSDETYRGQCLGNGGSWSAKAPDDPESVRARARLAGGSPHHEIDSLMEVAP